MAPRLTGTYTEDDDGAPVELNDGDAFEVVLEEVAGTGFRWQLVAADEAVLGRDGPLTDPPQGNTAGGRSHVRWRFTARSEGSTILRLAYGRSWEDQPARTFALQVTVH